MTEIRPREPVVLAADFEALVAWYRDVLGFTVVNLFDEGYHYCNLETPTGIELGIGSAEEAGVEPTDRAGNTVVLQFEVDDVRAFLAHVEEKGGSVTNGPSFDEKGGFWFGGFADPEGNPFWVVDANCP
jgi:predicted enzyme related to lactoylglutathione lyase